MKKAENRVSESTKKKVSKKLKLLQQALKLQQQSAKLLRQASQIKV